MKKILFLPIEIVEREFDSKLLLAFEALKRDYIVCLGHYLKLPKYAEKAGVGYYLHKAHTDYRAKKLFIPLTEQGVVCGALDEEGLVFPSFEHYRRNRVGEGLSFEYLRNVFTWGQIQCDELLKKYPNSKAQIISTGNPRIDLLKPPFQGFYKKTVTSIKRKYGNFVLINTNFGAWNYSPAFKRNYFDNMKYYGNISTPEEELRLKEKIEYYKYRYNSFVGMIKKLATEISPIQIIVRPHPAENHEKWKEDLKSIKNVKVIFNGSVVQWIQASMCMIHSGCTTGIEAFIMGKPVIRFQPNYNSKFESILTNSLGDEYTTTEHLIYCVKNILSGQYKFTGHDEQSQKLSEWISNAFNSYASCEIMNAIGKEKIHISDVTHIFSKRNNSCKKRLKNYLKIVKLWMIKCPLVGTFLPKKTRSKLYHQTQRFKGINRVEIQKKLSWFSKEISRNDSELFSIKKIENDVFLIEKYSK